MAEPVNPAPGVAPVNQGAISIAIEPFEAGPDDRAGRSGRVFKVGDRVRFKLMATNFSGEPVTVGVTNPYDQIRLHLQKNELTVDFSERVNSLLEKRKKDSSAIIFLAVTLTPGAPVHIGTIDMGDWYAPLDPGVYELKVDRLFFDKWVESGVLEFEVEP